LIFAVLFVSVLISQYHSLDVRLNASPLLLAYYMSHYYTIAWGR